MNNIYKLNKSECTGCGTCSLVCPSNAITMIETKEGFHYPSIDESKCTNCGICALKCHSLNPNFKTDHKKEFYEVTAPDEIRMKSSSGGMFTIIANYFLENGGYVVGASFSDDWLRVEHIIINDKKDLDKLRYSKYIESSLGSVFVDIKKLLDENKKVLFSGTPCQVSALNNYLGKDYDNLLTIDLLCNSIVPQKVWQKYLKEKVENLDDIEYISFRDKNIFKWDVGLYIKIKDNKYIKHSTQDTYMKIFLNHAGLKDCCLHCKYRKYDRVADITIGDYWSKKAKTKDNKGISIVKISSKKAEKIFNEIKPNCNYKEANVTHDGFGPWITPVWTNRKYFFENLDKEPIEELYKNCSDTKYNVGIVNMMITNNAGGVLTYYALYKLIEKLGYNPIIIFSKLVTNNLFDNSLGCKVALRYCNVGNSSISDAEFYKYNKYCDTFIVGADVVFQMSHPYIYYHLMNFVLNCKKKIAFSSSFVSYFQDYIKNIDIRKKSIMKYYFKKFDKISVREDDGIKILKEVYNIQAEHILDPIFMLDNYDELLNNSNVKKEGDYIAVYYSVFDDKIKEITNYLSKKLNMKVEMIPALNGYFNNNPQYTIEDWLYKVKNCKYFITNTFHGFCFGLYFNKNIIVSTCQGPARLLSLMRMFNLEDRVVENIEEIDDRNLLEEMDYTEINKKLKIEKERAINWLKEALEAPKIEKEDTYKDDLINVLIKDTMNMENSISNLNNSINAMKKSIDDLNTRMNTKKKKIKFLEHIFSVSNENDHKVIYALGAKMSFKKDKYTLNNFIKNVRAKYSTIK